VDIIIPTYDNAQQLGQCVGSLRTHNEYPIRIIVVNNGEADLTVESENVLLIKSEKNLGWTGGLQEGLKHSTSKYVVFANDDIYVPLASKRWLRNSIEFLEHNPTVGAVGPMSNVVMGRQNIWWKFSTDYLEEAKFLIGYCMVVRREALDKAGGVQDMEVGGDDIDLSIRLRDVGYDLVVLRENFIYHHGFQTGNRIYGDHTKPNGWNSKNMTEETNMELIRKHGFIKLWSTLSI